MDYRRYCQWAEWSLVATIVGLNLAIFCWRENPSRPNFLLSSVHDAQLLSAIVLIVGWIVLGPGRLWIRLTASPFLVGLWLLPWNRAMQPRDMPADFVVMLVGACLLLVGGLRISGLRASRSPVPMREGRSQFSIRGLILATTLIAIAIGILEAAKPILAGPGGASDFGLVLNPSPSQIQARGALMAAMVALAGVGGVWTVLRPGAVWIRLVAIGATIPPVGLYLAHLSDAERIYVGLTATTRLIPTAVNLAAVLAVVAAYCGLCVLPLRFLGFRLQRRPQVLTQAAERAEEQLPMTKRVAAIVSVCIAFGLLSQGVQIVPDSRLAYSGRININSIELDGLVALSRDDPTPINAMAQWINPNVHWLKLILCSSTSEPVFSQTNWLTFPLNDVQGWVGLPTGPAPGDEKADEQPQDQP